MKKTPTTFIVLLLMVAICAGWIIYSKSSGTMPGTRKDFSEFKKITRNVICADQINSLFSIDDKYVLWVREGSCPDNSYSYTLFGSSVAEDLCNLSDSIEGPRTSCKDQNVKPMFDTITNHLKDDYLGLGASHKVKKIQ